MFATREAGLRLAATAAGVPMGGLIPARGTPVTFDVDLDMGPDLAGHPVAVQVLRPGPVVPEVVDVVDGRAGHRLRFSVPLKRDDGDWVVLRVADPSRPSDAPAPFDHPCNDWGLAYSSPWWLDWAGPGRGRGPVIRPPTGRPAVHGHPWWAHHTH